MTFARKHWVLILGTVLLFYVLWLGSNDGTPAVLGESDTRSFGTNSDLDGLMDAATSGSTSVTIAGETVKF